MFTHFFDWYLIFEKFDQKSQKKSLFSAKISFFGAKNAKMFKNKKLIKKWENFP